MYEMESVVDSNKKILRVGNYYRLSDEDKNKASKEDESESIKNQRVLLKEFIDKNPQFVLVDEYCDEDLSGAGTYRPEFERLIRDCENGKLDVVLCKSQSRFSRDMEVIEKYLHNKFIEWSIRFISLSDNADTSNQGNKKSRQINGLVNEWYLEDVSNNIRAAFNAKMKNGEFISPFACFGYEISTEDNNVLVVDPYASGIVKDIFDMYLRGYGYGSIAKHLNDKNIPSPSVYKRQKGIKLNIISSRNLEDIKWSSNAIKTILTNETYLGHLIQGKRTTVSYKNKKIIKKDKSQWIKSENVHEPIIEENIFNRVKVMMKERTRVSNRTKQIHKFSGKVFCLCCNHYLKRNCTSKHEYLVCTSNRDGYDYCENKLSMRYDVLEDIILNAINSKIDKYFSKDVLDEASKNYKSNNKYGNKIRGLSLQLEELEKKVNDTRGYLKALYEDKVNGVINANQFKDLMEDYQEQEDKYKDQIKAIKTEIDYYDTKEKTLKNNNDILSKYRNLEELNRLVIDEFIERIYVGTFNSEKTSRDIKIKWNLEI